jgi:hypothetical protein
MVVILKQGCRVLYGLWLGLLRARGATVFKVSADDRLGSLYILEPLPEERMHFFPLG